MAFAQLSLGGIYESRRPTKVTQTLTGASSIASDSACASAWRARRPDTVRNGISFIIAMKNSERTETAAATMKTVCVALENPTSTACLSVGTRLEIPLVSFRSKP